MKLTQHWFYWCLQNPNVRFALQPLGHCGWNESKTCEISQQKQVSPWNGSWDWGGAAPALAGSIPRGWRLFASAVKSFFPYCSRGRPVKLSSACEGCFIPPANLQSCGAISAHWRYTVKKDSKGQFVKKAQRQTNIIAPPPFLTLFFKHPPIEMQSLIPSRAAAFVHFQLNVFIFFMIINREEHLLPSWGLDEDKCFFLWSSQFLLTI